MKKINETNRILIVVIILAVLIAGLIVIRWNRRPLTPNSTTQPVVNEPASADHDAIHRIHTEPGHLTVKSGERFVLNTLISTDRPLDGADAILHFDPEYLSADSVDNGRYFSQLVRTQIDQAKGTIKVTGFLPEKDASYEFFSVLFTAKKRGSTQVTIEYQPDSTRGSALVEHQTSKNLLNQVTGSEITIE